MENINLYEKRDGLSFFIVRMTNFHSNIPSSVFYVTVMSDILCITRSSSSVIGFFWKNHFANNTMEKQDGNRAKLTKQIMKAYETHQLVFQKWHVSNRDILKVL